MLFAVFVVQAVAVGAAWLLRSREQLLRSRLPYLVSVAVGVLTATALLHLLPEAVQVLGNRQGLWLALGLTLLALFSAERGFQLLLGEPAHAGHTHVVSAYPHSPTHTLRPGNLLLASSLHSFVDGVAIAAAYAVNPRLGLLTATAVVLHEIPHRLGDVAVLLHLGLGPARAMRFVVLAGVPALFGAGAVLLLGRASSSIFAWLLPVSAGSFLYIAGVNLLPELHAGSDARSALLQLLCLAAGVGIVLAATGLHAG